MANTDRQNEEQRSRDMTGSRHGAQVARRGGHEAGQYYDDPFTNPFAMMRRMHDEMDRVFSDLFGGRPANAEPGGGVASWAPAVEVSEREDQLSVCAELPGLKPEDVKVEVTDDALVIEGERKQEHEERQGGRWHSERRYGRFCRTIPLPEGADSEQIRADFKNGELRVTVPLHRPKSTHRQIPIGGASAEAQTKK
jgi:HSP20 family protein